MIHSVKAHFEERDVHDLRAAQHHHETVLDHADYPQARRLEIMKNIIAGYAPTSLSVRDDGRGQYSVPVAQQDWIQPYAEYARAAMQLRTGM